jgi:hypothetical protein
LVQNVGQLLPNTRGLDYQFYITDIVSARVYAENLIKDVVAEGIRLSITIIYPSDVGLGKAGTPESEVKTVFGE